MVGYVSRKGEPLACENPISAAKGSAHSRRAPIAGAQPEPEGLPIAADDRQNLAGDVA
jgi:hypothetical protein